MGLSGGKCNWPFECSAGKGDPVWEWTGTTPLLSGGLSSTDFLHKDEELTIRYSEQRTPISAFLPTYNPKNSLLGMLL
jgi:hypothetical protein